MKTKSCLFAFGAVIVTFAVFRGSNGEWAIQSVTDNDIALESTARDSCPPDTCRVMPNLYPVGWEPFIEDLEHFRDYDPSKIPGVGRLTQSPDGSVMGELLNERQCEKLSAGKYIFVMKWQIMKSPLTT